MTTNSDTTEQPCTNHDDVIISLPGDDTVVMECRACGDRTEEPAEGSPWQEV